ELAARPREGVRAATLAGVLRLSQIAFLAAGEREAAEAIWAEMHQLADRTHDPALMLMPLVADALQALLDGDLEGALEQARELVERGEEIGYPTAARTFAVQFTRRPLFYLGRPEEAATDALGRGGPRNDGSH